MTPAGGATGGAWQPIETAPRDGTAVLVMSDNWTGTKTGRAEECNGDNTYVAQWWKDDGCRGVWECPVEPTHWMPLPPPPSASASSSAGGDGERINVERDAYKMLAEGLDKLCAAYRTGRPPSEKTFQQIEKARGALGRAGEEIT